MADVLPEIERALSSGATRAAVVQALSDEGISMTLRVFAMNLYRLRRASPKPAASVLQAPTPAPAPSASVATSPGLDTPHRFGQHDPRRLEDVMRSTPDMKALAKLGGGRHP